MTKKIFFGLLLVIFGLLYTLQRYLPESLLMYFFNYQMILMLLGLFNLFKKNKTSGSTLFLIGLYLYLQEFFQEYFDMYFPLLLLTVGIVVLSWGIYEKKQKDKKEYEKNTFSFKSKTKVKESEIEDAKEVK